MKNINKGIISSSWLDYPINIDSNILTFKSLEYSVTKFWFEIINKITENQIILVQLKYKDQSNNYRSISYVQEITHENKNLAILLKIFKEFWSIKCEKYHLSIIKSLIFTYKIIENKNKIIFKPKLNSPKSTITNKYIKFSGWNLPNTMDFTTWGRTIFINDYKAIVYKNNSEVICYINIFDKYTEVKYSISNRIIFSFIDTMKDNSDLSSFVRVIKNQEYIFENGQLIVKKVLRKCSYLQSIKLSPFLENKFITMDLETFTNNGIVIPYCVSIFDGQQSQSFYLLDYDSSDHMLIESVKFLMKRKYSGYKIYLHNFSNFDGIFLIRILSTLSDNIKPIIRDHRIIDLKFKFDNKYILYFRDSYLMLPTSLKKLAIQFNVENKTIFPYSFVTKNNLDFIGNVPEFKYFNGLQIYQYIDYKNLFDKDWSLRDESIKYCVQDCVTLYKVINEFNKQIFSLFRINIHNYPTLSSLAFAIYRSNFLGDFKIPLISGQMYDEFKKGYTGGAVDVYKLYGENIFRYDVNSLYPYIMKNSLMPVGSPVYFEGDITKIENKPYGIFFCEVESPNNLNEPIIQKRIKSVNGIRTVAPLGKWSGIYFSGEIYNAINYGYKFKIIRGYLFDSKLIFNDYVNFLYNLKNNSEKRTANYIISKLLLNSLYGRFGMSPDMENYALINSNETMNYINKYIITDILDLHNGKEIISYLPDNLSKEDNDFKGKNLNISIPISLVITAAARVHMSQFKNNLNYTLYYSDTDSNNINKPLPDNFIGKELGKMKLEHKFNKIIFLSSKVYGGITNEYEIVKIKGVKNPVKFENLLPLLKKDNKLVINQDKWYKSISEGKIIIKDEIYTLMVTENKRKLIYDNNKLIETKPLIINDTQIINEN